MSEAAAGKWRREAEDEVVDGVGEEAALVAGTRSRNDGLRLVVMGLNTSLWSRFTCLSNSSEVV